MTPLKGILDLRYFGSTVREDNDSASDVDVLCIVQNKKNIDLEILESKLDKTIIRNRPIDFSIYRHTRIKEMFQEGHLFAWHIFKESKPATLELDFIRSIGSPAQYSNAKSDIHKLLDIALDCNTAIKDPDCSITYEAGLLYVACRNIGISASWYSDNGLNFSREAPYSLRINKEPSGVPLKKETYAKLCAARHSIARGYNAPQLDKEEISNSASIILQWGNSLLKRLEERT